MVTLTILPGTASGTKPWGGVAASDAIPSRVEESTVATAAAPTAAEPTNARRDREGVSVRVLVSSSFDIVVLRMRSCVGRLANTNAERALEYASQALTCAQHAHHKAANPSASAVMPALGQADAGGPPAEPRRRRRLSAW